MRKKGFRQILVAIMIVFIFTIMISCGMDESILQEDTRNLTEAQFTVQNLAGVDDFGRSFDKVDSFQDQYVGMFYFTWLGQQGLYKQTLDITKLYEKDPAIVWDTVDRDDSPLYAFHFWGEPLYGYYNSADPYVIRKHCEMLTMAGVDFVMIDVTNAATYDNVWIKMFEIYDEYRLQGFNVPKIGFVCNTRSNEVVRHLYDVLYSKNLYKELWFSPTGKPMIVASKIFLKDQELLDYFNVRSVMLNNEPFKSDAFPWLDHNYPQTIFGNDNYLNIMSVSVAQNRTGRFSDSIQFDATQVNNGRGYDGKINDSSKILSGVNFERQWYNAIEKKDKIDIAFVTGFNEWTAQKLLDTGKVFFADTFNLEYSRDIEPTKNGYKDNFYLQLMNNIRKFKGTAGKDYIKKKNTIDINGDISQWNDITNSYLDFENDAINRDYIGAFADVYYKSDTARNDIKRIKVAADDENLYFYIECSNVITSPIGNNWLNLYLDTNSQLNFGGFDYIVNRNINGNISSIDKLNSTFDATNTSNAAINLKDNILQIKIKLTSVGLSKDNKNFKFKLTDNLNSSNDITDFYVSGDSAPIGRLSYSF